MFVQIKVVLDSRSGSHTTYAPLQMNGMPYRAFYETLETELKNDIAHTYIVNPSVITDLYQEAQIGAQM